MQVSRDVMSSGCFLADRSMDLYFETRDRKEDFSSSQGDTSLKHLSCVASCGADTEALRDSGYKWKFPKIGVPQ